MDHDDAVDKLDWVPLYFQKIKASDAWKLTDTQFGWYMKLLIESYDSDMPGYLPGDIVELSRLAGARTTRYFQREAQSVLGRFFRRTADGLWIYNPRVLAVIAAQAKKAGKGKNKSPENGILFFDALSLSSLEKEVSLSLIQPARLREITKRVFTHYQHVFRRDDRYKLTPERAKRCELRLLEYFKQVPSLEAIEAAAKEAIDNLAASAFHMDNGHYDWIAQIFKSDEEFQKRLAMRPIVPPKPTRHAEAQVGSREQFKGAKGIDGCYFCGEAIPAERADLPTDDSRWCSPECKDESNAKAAKAKAMVREAGARLVRSRN